MIPWSLSPCERLGNLKVKDCFPHTHVHQATNLDVICGRLLNYQLSEPAELCVLSKITERTTVPFALKNSVVVPAAIKKGILSENDYWS